MRCVAILAEKTQKFSRNLASSPCHTLFPVAQPKHRILEKDNCLAQSFNIVQIYMSRSKDGTEYLKVFRAVSNETKLYVITKHRCCIYVRFSFQNYKDVQICRGKPPQG